MNQYGQNPAYTAPLDTDFSPAGRAFASHLARTAPRQLTAQHLWVLSMADLRMVIWTFTPAFGTSAATPLEIRIRTYAEFLLNHWEDYQEAGCILALRAFEARPADFGGRKDGEGPGKGGNGNGVSGGATSTGAQGAQA